MKGLSILYVELKIFFSIDVGIGVVNIIKVVIIYIFILYVVVFCY